MRLFATDVFTPESNKEASMAVVLFRKPLRADKILLMMVVKYLLVPIPRTLLSLRRALGLPFTARRAKGAGKGPTTVAVSPRGVFAVDLKSESAFHLSTLGQVRTLKPGFPCHAAILAWDAIDQLLRQSPAATVIRLGLEMGSLRAAAIDDAGCLCAIGANFDLLRWTSTGDNARWTHAKLRIGNIREALSDDACEQTGVIDLAVVGKDWFISDMFAHQVIRWVEGIGAEVMHIEGASPGHVLGLQAGQLAWPRGIAVDDCGNLFIAQDVGFQTGQVVQCSHKFASCHPTPAHVIMRNLHSPTILAVDGTDILVCESGRRRILKLRRCAFSAI